MSDGYLDFVEEQANKLNKVFMLDAGEGKDFDYKEKGWYVEELSGWLIDPEDKQLFLQSRDEDTLDDVFKDNFVWVKWEMKNDELQIYFEKLPVSY